jgi:hypothetical protein
MNLFLAQRHRLPVLLTVLVFVAHALFFVHVRHAYPSVGVSSETRWSGIGFHMAYDGVYSSGERDDEGNLLVTLSAPPVWPALYAKVFHFFGRDQADEIVRILQVLLNLGIVILVYAMGRRISLRVGLLAGAFAAIDVTAIVFALYARTPDIAVAFFVGLSLYWLMCFFESHATRHIAFSAFALGFALWTKVLVFLLWIPISFVLVLYLCRQKMIQPKVRLKLMMVFLSIITLFFGGWIMRNKILTGHVAFSSHAGGAALWNASYLVSFQRDISFAEAKQWIRESYYSDELLALDEAEQSDQIVLIGKQIIFSSPLTYGAVMLRRIPNLLLGAAPPYIFFPASSGTALVKRVEESAGHRVILLELLDEGHFMYVALWFGEKILFILLYLLSVVGFLRMLSKQSTRWIAITFLSVVAYILVVVTPIADPRLRSSMMMIFYVTAGVGARGMYHWLQAKQVAIR